MEALSFEGESEVIGPMVSGPSVGWEGLRLQISVDCGVSAALTVNAASDPVIDDIDRELGL